MQAAPSNRPILRLTLTTTLALLLGTPLVACNKEDTTTDTAGGPAGEQGRAGEVQPSGQQATGQQSMGQQQQEMGAAQTGSDQAQPGTQAGQGQQGAQDVMAARADQGCPMMVEGASVEVENTDDGVALRFTSGTATKVEDLRKRVEGMARMYERHSGDQAGAMMWHPMGHKRADRDQAGAAGQGQGPSGAMPALTTRVEEIENGARLVLTPKDQSQLASLREHAREHERRMKSGECWMAQGQMGGAQGQGQGQNQGQTGNQGRSDAGSVGQDKPGHRPGESAPGDGRPKT